MGNLENSTTIDLQTETTCTTSSTFCFVIQNLITTTDGNYETTGDVSLDVNWNIPTLKTLTVKEGDKFIIASKLIVNGKIIVENNGTLNNGNDNNLSGTIVNTGSLVVYGTLNNNLKGKLDNTSGEVSYSGTITNNGNIEKKNNSYGIFYKSVVGKPTFDKKPGDLKLTEALFGTLTSDSILIFMKSISVPKNTELIINSNGKITIYDGEIDNFGTITNNKGGEIDNKKGGTITNNSIINNNSLINNDDGVIDNYQNISNKGTINDFDGTINNIEPNGTINPKGTINGNPLKEGSSEMKVNVGSFKGYVALYAKGYAGQRMSAKVGKDWVVVPALASDFERVVEFTGAGVDVAVKIYIDRVLIDTFDITTK